MRNGWVLPVAIDPHAGRESVIGSRWHRREPEGDEYDVVTVTGCFDLGPDYGLEMTLRPEGGHAPIITASPESFAATYTRSAPSDPAEDLSARLAEIEARG